MESRAKRAKLTAAKLVSWISIGCDLKASVHVKIGQQRGQNDDQAGVRQADPARPNREHTREPAFADAEYPQVASAHRPTPWDKTYSYASQGDPRISGNENWTPVNFLYSLRDDQRQAFRGIASVQQFDAGERLMREGDHADHVAVITSGLTEVRVRENGADRIVAERGPGQLVGERAALKVSRRSATVEAVVPVRALIVQTEDFQDYISTYPEVLELIEKQLFTRMREYRPGLAWPDLAGQNCTVIRTDVAGFSARYRSAGDRELVRVALRGITRQALGPLGLECWLEDRGDGHLIVVQASIPTAEVVERLTTALPPLLREHNRIHRAPAQITLRVAVEVGPVKKDPSGVSGDAIIDVTRMVDAPAFKHAMTIQGAEFGIIVSPFVHRAHVAPRGGLAEYAKVHVGVKEARRSAWMRLAGTAQLGQVQLTIWMQTRFFADLRTGRLTPLRKPTF
jgi:Cyclic nucleotide-binding domain